MADTSEEEKESDLITRFTNFVDSHIRLVKVSYFSFHEQINGTSRVFFSIILFPAKKIKYVLVCCRAYHG